LGPEKRADLFLEVLAEVRRLSAASVQGIVAGDGPQLQSLQERASRLGLLPKGVQFRRAVPDMAPLYQEADMLVLTSDWEGTPNVVLEASASGLPVVATRAGGTPDAVRDGKTGFLCDREDKPGLVSAVLRLITDNDLRRRVGEQGRMFVVEHYSSHRLTRFLAGLYTKVLA
jgi:glycosyltransferase involved in cell wall biosynthesis